MKVTLEFTKTVLGHFADVVEEIGKAAKEANAQA